MSNYWLRKELEDKMDAAFDKKAAEAILIYKSYPRDQFCDYVFKELWYIGELLCKGQK